MNSPCRKASAALFPLLCLLVFTIAGFAAPSAFADNNTQRASIIRANSGACGSSVVESAYITSSGTRYGSVQLHYDSCNRYVWASGTTYLTCNAGSNPHGCLTVFLIPTNGSPGQTCLSDVNGQPQESCTTKSQSDANITSVAQGLVCLGTGADACDTAAYGTTGAF
jgi:hypothetical protein